MKHGGLFAWQGNGLSLADGIATALLEAESISWRIFTLEPLRTPVSESIYGIEKRGCLALPYLR